MSQPHRFQRKPLAAALGIALLPLMSSPVQAQLEEVVVTATKQEASLQDVPVAVSALTEESIDQRGISNFSDYLIELPNVSAGGAGPGRAGTDRTNTPECGHTPADSRGGLPASQRPPGIEDP